MMNHTSMQTIQGYFEDAHQSVLDRVQHLDLELQAVSIGLKNKFAEAQRLREQMNRFFEYLPIAAILMNHDRTIQQVNRAARAIPGLGEVMVEGRSLDKAWRQLGWPSVPCTHVAHHGHTLNCWEEVLGQPGTVPCLVVRFICEDQTVPFSNQRAKDERLRVMGERVAKVSHDLRNSLTSIELFASLVERRMCNDVEHQRVGHHLVQAIQTLEQFVDNLLATAKAREARIEEIQVHSLFDQVELLLTQPSQDRQVTIRRNVAVDAEVIEGDHVLLQQACLNIFRNAISASPQGAVIDIECRRVRRTLSNAQKQKRSHDVHICVRDYGCGIKADELPYVCQPFYSKQNHGTGLGLSIVKDVMDAHHGTIDVRSREQQGTTVSLRFPQQRRSA
ncbi:MAG: hypothetical protein NPIRA04_27060 [Nitrospirales bacterium]|nr:MAG: hypothetical protein NPIRA04_27060 [Nitrospirales bacterium]